MRYSNFIRDTLSLRNRIQWNYYRTPMDTEHILDAANAQNFIQDYFHTGEKNLPLLLEPAEANQFIDRYFTAGHKKLALSFQFDARHQLPPERASHTVSGFFLGLLLENCLNGLNPISIQSQYGFPFSYLWFLTYLYHDYGYCIAERNDLPNPFPSDAPLPNCRNINSCKLYPNEYRALSKIKDVLGISLSPFSQFPNYAHRGHRDRIVPPYLDRDILCKLTNRNNTISSKHKLTFTNGASIQGHRYTSATVTRYLNYCINERKRVDHGIIGGLLFYDRMLKNYMLAYATRLRESVQIPDLEDFNYKGRHFCVEQLKIFSYISDCILSHNVWKQPEDKRAEYEQYRLFPLLVENFTPISYEENPLLYILVVADTLEPVKAYTQNDPDLHIEEIIDAIDIEYVPASRSLMISSTSSDIDIAILHRKAQGLAEWTSVRCSSLNNNSFRLIL